MKFITYFDYLGFGDFIRNNDLEYQQKIMGNIFRDIETALSKGKLMKSTNGYVADLSSIKVHCINFSDTVVFWTNGNSIEELEELLHITHKFNWQANLHFFPVRGTMVLGELEEVVYAHKSINGGSYNINSVFGKGLVEAHEIAESQQWAGTLLNDDVVEFIKKHSMDSENFLNEYTKSFLVPFKNGDKEMKVFHLVKGELNDSAFTNFSDSIKANFARHKKSMTNPGVSVKIENTLKFLSSYRNNKTE